MIPTCLLTNNKHLWLLPGFAHLWNKFYGAPVTVFGYNPPDFDLPQNFTFISLGNQNAPIEKWSDGLIKAIGEIGYHYFILMLEDYWLTRPVDKYLLDKVSDHNSSPAHKTNILRLDLSGNRAAYKQARTLFRLPDNLPSDYKIVETPENTPYQMSFQAAIWHKHNLLSVLREGETPWEAEVDGSKRVGGLRVLGTRPAVLHYKPVYRVRSGGLNLEGVPDVEYMRGKGWLK